MWQPILAARFCLPLAIEPDKKRARKPRPKTYQRRRMKTESVALPAFAMYVAIAMPDAGTEVL